MDVTHTPVPSLRDFYLSVKCPTCKANPYEPCDVKRGDREFHLRRQDKGVGKSQGGKSYTSPDERISGQRYDTLDPRKVEVWEVRKWVWRDETRVSTLDWSVTRVRAEDMTWTDDTMTRMVVPS